MFILTAGAGALASTVVGGLLGGGSSGGGNTQSTQSKSPWEPAQPYLLKDLQTNQDLQDWYTKNPFNAQQKVGFQNTLGDADHFRSNIMPGLMNFANQGMTGSYQRQTGGAPGSGGGYGGAVSPAGLLQGGQGVFSAPRGGLFGTIQWDGDNTPAAASAAATSSAAAPTTYQAGQSNNPIWESVLGDFNASHQSRFGIPMNRSWDSDADSQRTYAGLQEEYRRRQTAAGMLAPAPAQQPVGPQGINPFTNGHMGQLATRRTAEAELERKRLALLQAQQAIYGYSDGGTGGDGPGNGDAPSGDGDGDGSGVA